MSDAARVLVTGGSGFIGGRCLPLLAEAGFEVHAVTPDVCPPSGEVLWHRADLLSTEAVQSLVDDVRASHLLHFAWHATHGDYWTSPENLRWVVSGIDLARAFTSAGGRRAVMAGTCAEYDWSSGTCIDGVTPLKPASLYGASKCALHATSMAYYELEGISAAWAHIFYLYGPGEHPDRLVPSAARTMLAGREFVCMHPDHVRDYMHVDDVASAFVSLLASDVRGDVNISGGQSVSIGEIVAGVAAAAGRPGLVRLQPTQDGSEPLSLIADATRLTHEVGWKPRYSLKHGIAETVEWWREKLAQE